MIRNKGGSLIFLESLLLELIMSMCVRIPTAWCLRSRAEASRQGVSLDDARASSTVFALSTPLLLGNPLPSYLNSPSIPPSFSPLFLSFPPLSPLPPFIHPFPHLFSGIWFSSIPSNFHSFSTIKNVWLGRFYCHF